MNARRIRTFAALLSATLLAACGPGTQEEPTTPGSGPRRSAPDDAADGMQIEGLGGSLRRDEVDPVMNRAVSRFMRCYADQLDEHPFLAGDLALSFTVAPDGSVASLRATSSTLGSREALECILEVSRGLRFPRPHGGAPADFDYGPVMFNPGEGASPPELWDRSRVNETLDLEDNAAALDECRTSGLSVTFYVGPGGRVRSIGAVAPSAEREEAARCLERALAGFVYPDPGSRVAKVTLEL